MIVELKFILSNSVRKKGTGLFKIYVYDKNKKQRIALKTLIDKSFPIQAYDKTKKTFNNKYFDTEEFDFLNQLFEKKKNEIVKQHPMLELEKKKKPSSKISYAEYFESDFQLRQIKKNTMDKYTSSKNNFIQFLHEVYERKDIFFNQFSNEVIKKYQLWLKKEGSWADSTQGKFKSNLRTIINAAIEDELISVVDNRMFSGISFEKAKNNTIYMNKKQVQNLISLNLTPFSNLEKAQNSLKLQLLLQGIRVSDLLLLRFKNIDLETNRVNIVSKKNNKKIIIYLDFSLKIHLYKSLLYHLLNPSSIYNIRVESNPILRSKISDIDKNILKYEDIQIDYFIKKRKKELEKAKEHIAELELIKIQINNDFKTLHHECLLFISDEFIVPWLDSHKFKNFSLSKITDNHERYIKSATTNYNNSLVDLQKIAKIVLKDNASLRSHIMRHTWANLALDSPNSDIYSISKALGHSSLTETERYLRDFDDLKVKELSERINMDFTVSL